MIRNENIKELKSYIEELKTIKREQVTINGCSKESFLSIEKYLCTLNNGRVIPREKLNKGKKDGSAVIVIPELINGEYLTIIEPRVFTITSIGVGFPAGYINEFENPLTAALRELREETGYVTKSPLNVQLLDSFYQDEGISSAYNHIFYVPNCFKKYDQELDKDEVVRYMSFSKEELEYLEKEGYICGGNSKLALRYIL